MKSPQEVEREEIERTQREWLPIEGIITRAVTQTYREFADELEKIDKKDLYPYQKVLLMQDLIDKLREAK